MMYLLCEWKVPKGSDVCFYVSEMFDIGSTLHTTQQISEAALERSEYLLVLVTEKVLGAVQGVGECSRCLAAEWGEVCLLHEVVEDGLYGGGSVVMVMVVPMSRVSRPARSPTVASAHPTQSHCHGETQRDSKSQETRVSECLDEVPDVKWTWQAGPHHQCRVGGVEISQWSSEWRSGQGILSNHLIRH